MLFYSLHSLHSLVLHDADAVPYVHKPGHCMIDLSHKRECQSFTAPKNTSPSLRLNDSFKPLFKVITSFVISMEVNGNYDKSKKLKV